MNGQERMLAKLVLLQATGQLPRSQCSNSLLKLVRPLFATDVLAEERSGAGRKIVILNHVAFEKFFRQTFPDHRHAAGLSTRVAGVHRFKDSKTFPSDDPPVVLVRAWKDTVLRKNGEPCGADVETRMHSLFSFQARAQYSLHAPCALVENPAVFRLFEHLGLDLHLVIYGQGRVSARLLEWLKNQSDPHFSLVHLPDYDPVGLNEFERLRRALGQRIQLYIPRQLEQVFQQYSNRKLLLKLKSQKMLANLRNSDCTDVQLVIKLIDRYNAGLEQEALLPT